MKQHSYRQPTFLALAALFTSLSIARTSLGQEGLNMFPFPPVEPVNERPVENARTFVQECNSLFDTLGYTKKYSLGRSIQTQSDEWGLVYRVDFSIPGLDTHDAINRIICWKKLSGETTVIVAIGQNVPPLSSSP